MGRVGGEQLLSIGPNCLRTGVIIHEIMHALGFFHEHSRPDRDEHITVELENLRPGMEHNFLTLNLRNWFNMSIPYDTKSVMHYSGYAFAADKSKPSITYIGTGNPVRAQRIGMSILDKGPGSLSKVYRPCMHIFPFKALNPDWDVVISGWLLLLGSLKSVKM